MRRVLTYTHFEKNAFLSFLLFSYFFFLSLRAVPGERGALGLDASFRGSLKINARAVLKGVVVACRPADLCTRGDRMLLILAELTNCVSSSCYFRKKSGGAGGESRDRDNRSPCLSRAFQEMYACNALTYLLLHARMRGWEGRERERHDFN